MNSLRIRVGALCSENDSLLLVEHEKQGKRYWLPPGGGMQAGETIAAALAREVLEETSIEIETGNLVCVCESISPDKKRHIVHFLCETKLVSGAPGASSDYRVRRSAFIPVDELDSIILHPPIQEWLQMRLIGGFIDGPEYLGAMWI